DVAGLEPIPFARIENVDSLDIPVFGAKQEVTAALVDSPAVADVCIECLVVVPARLAGRHIPFDSREILVENEVDNAGNRVRTIRCRSAAGDDVDSRYQRVRQIVD